MDVFEVCGCTSPQLSQVDDRKKPRSIPPRIRSFQQGEAFEIDTVTYCESESSANIRESYHHEQEINDNKGAVRRRNILLFLTCLVVALIIGLSVGAGVNKKDNQQISSANSALVPLSPRAEAFKDILTNVTDPSLFGTQTPQRQALEWLADVDEAAMDPVLVLDQREVTERYIAAVFYYSTGGTEWQNSFDFLSKNHVCQWTYEGNGINCDGDGYIRILSIMENNLNGRLPSELNLLASLEILDLYYNSLTGEIPDVSDLGSLERVDLAGNKLSGDVPASLFQLPYISILYLQDNPDLTGTIPEIEDGSRLERISFHNCSLSGSLPESIGSASNLKFLQFFNNDLSGSIPSGLTVLPHLEALLFRGNKLSGNIPSFAGQQNLDTVSLGENSLEGPVPSTIWDLPGLKKLYLNANALDGEIQSNIDNVPMLEHLWLHDNQFQGSLPGIGNTQVTQAYFSNNGFTGDLENFFGNVPTTIEWLDLSHNSFEGSIPTTVGELNGLLYLSMAHCDLTGSIPAQLGDLANLDSLFLHGNQMTGDLSSIICSARVSPLTADCAESTPVSCNCCTACY